MSDVVIRVENLSKHYRLGQISGGTLREDLQSWWAGVRGRADPLQKVDAKPISGSGEHWALQDVSFDVRQGEVLGIIGRNGAGKSTLLKILSRTTAPTKGRVRIKGRVGSLLEVGTGFHPELSGRENIYLNGTILGMRKAEIDRKLDEIIDFSGVEKFIDTPVKRYSSGMYVRLAFAVAAHLEPEILIVDEVLAVGDSEFQKKCMGKMKQVGKEGRTVIFVSHNLSAVRNLCGSGLLLKAGKIISKGDIEKVLSDYMEKDNSLSGFKAWDDGDSPGTDELQLRKISILQDGIVTSNVVSHKEIAIDIEILVHRELRNIDIGLIISESSGVKVVHTGSCVGSADKLLRKGLVRVSFMLPPNVINIGNYVLDVVGMIPNVQFFFYMEGVLNLNVVESGNNGMTYPENSWKGVFSPRVGRWSDFVNLAEPSSGRR